MLAATPRCRSDSRQVRMVEWRMLSRRALATLIIFKLGILTIMSTNGYESNTYI